MAGEVAAAAGARVSVYERMPSVGRKFLLAGRGGLNLTHSEDLAPFLARYGQARARLEPILRAFPPDALRAWADSLGAETFVGSSGRVFPRAMKASPLLRAWLARLALQGATIRLHCRWTGWNEAGALCFETPDGVTTDRPDAVVLALGGASWARLGSDGAWTAILRDQTITPLAPANCGFDVAWSTHMRDRFAGAPLKNVAMSAEGRSVRGEAMITASGLEGGAVYALAGDLRRAIAAQGPRPIVIDLKPDIPLADIQARLLARPPSRSWGSFLRTRLGLSAQAIALMREAGPFAQGALAARIKGVALTALSAAPLDRAISTAGGLAFDDLDACLMLKQRPGVFVAGEMLDWEAPTGGYLLQAAFATGRWAGEHAARTAHAAAAARASEA
jgi:hypothetical protein